MPTASCGSHAATMRLPVSTMLLRWRGAIYPATPVTAKLRGDVLPIVVGVMGDSLNGRADAACAHDERGYGVDHAALLRGRELAVDRQRQSRRRRRFSCRKVAFLVAEICEARLQVERQRIVNLRSDTVRRKALLQTVTISSSNDELIEDVSSVGRFRRQHDLVG